MVKIAPSILSADFSNLEKEIKKVKRADLIHLDVMDGHFVPNISFGPMLVRTVRKMTKKPLDVHLMIKDPEKYIGNFAKAGANIITIHAEACNNLLPVIRKIKESGCKVGIALKPETGLETISELLAEIDMVVVMAVNPGFGGQKFMKEVLPKIGNLRKMTKSKKLKIEIEVDGGVNLENCEEIVKAGASILVSGFGIFSTKDPGKTLEKMRKTAE